VVVVTNSLSYKRSHAAIFPISTLYVVRQVATFLINKAE